MAAEIMPKIGLLATGDELTNGDVLNTNSQNIANRLFEHSIQPGLHLTVNDDQSEIEAAMRLLLQNHAALIITGGLGPTSDDRTRFALAKVLDTPLVFNETCWEKVVERLQRLSLPIPETNRQQCLFPAQAIIFPNDNGSAAGCRIDHGGQVIFLLPGPPYECLPIFENLVLPCLISKGYGRQIFRHQWLLLNVSEGSIASILDPLMENSGCYVGYRINYPYLEVKLQSDDAAALEKLRYTFDEAIGSKSVSSHKQKASAQLKQYVQENQCVLRIDDRATGGLLATTLLEPATYPYFDFNGTSEYAPTVDIRLKNMRDYWQNEATSTTLLELEIRIGQDHRHLELTVPFRKQRTLFYAVEMASWEILRAL